MQTAVTGPRPRPPTSQRQLATLADGVAGAGRGAQPLPGDRRHRWRRPQAVGGWSTPDRGPSDPAWRATRGRGKRGAPTSDAGHLIPGQDFLAVAGCCARLWPIPAARPNGWTPSEMVNRDFSARWPDPARAGVAEDGPPMANALRALERGPRRSATINDEVLSLFGVADAEGTGGCGEILQARRSRLGAGRAGRRWSRGGLVHAQGTTWAPSGTTRPAARAALGRPPICEEQSCCDRLWERRLYWGTETPLSQADLNRRLRPTPRLSRKKDDGP